MNKVLFLTYDGILEPLGYSQILSYLKHLSKENKITIISFEKKIDLSKTEHFKKIKDKLENNKISWFYFKYTENKLLRLFLIARYVITIIYFFKIKKINIIHSRSYVTGFIAYILKYIFKFHFIFDMRGFWIDERIEWGLWKENSLKTLFFRYFENRILSKSDSIVTLTNDAKQILIQKRIKNLLSNNIFTIPTCVALSKDIKLSNSNNKIKFTHLGAIGSRYNFELYLKIMKKISNIKDIHLSIINKNEHSKIKKLLLYFNFPNEIYEVRYVEPYDVSYELKNSNFGVFFPINGYYLKGYFPTKLGEFISNGVPVITCRINNHVDSIIENNNIGIIIDNIDNINYELLLKKISKMLNDRDIKERCIKVAKEHFDINMATEMYSKIYKQVN